MSTRMKWTPVLDQYLLIMSLQNNGKVDAKYIAENWDLDTAERPTVRAIEQHLAKLKKRGGTGLNFSCVEKNNGGPSIPRKRVAKAEISDEEFTIELGAGLPYKDPISASSLGSSRANANDPDCGTIKTESSSSVSTNRLGDPVKRASLGDYGKASKSAVRRRPPRAASSQLVELFRKDGEVLDIVKVDMSEDEHAENIWADMDVADSDEDWTEELNYSALDL